MSNEPALITGATSKTGRRVARLLEEAGISVVRALRSSPTSMFREGEDATACPTDSGSLPSQLWAVLSG